MYYGRQFDVKFFQGKFELASVEGSIDDRGCHFVFVKTAAQIRTSQLHAAINEYNLCVPSIMAMRLQEEIYQPVIVTMSSRRMEGSIYSKIIKDKQTRCVGGTSNYWFWDPELEERLSLSDEAGGLQLADQAGATSSGNGKQVSMNLQSQHLDWFDIHCLCWQCELVTVIREQHALLGESSRAVEEAMAQINDLDGEKTRLGSQWEQVNVNASAMALEIHQLKATATAVAAKVVLLVTENENLKAEVAAKDQLINDLSIANSTNALEIDALKSSISAKNATILQLQQAQESVGISGTVVVLREELKRAQQAVNLNADFADSEKARADAALLQVQNLQNPTAAGGTFSRVVDVVKAAALATRSGPNYVWEHAECEALVRTMVEGMVAVSRAERAKTVNGMVVQVGVLMLFFILIQL